MRIRAFLTVCVAASVALAGCSKVETDQKAVDEARAQGVALEKARQKAAAEKARQKALTERIRRLEQQQRQAARRAAADKRRAAAQATAAHAAPAAPSSPGSSCGGGLSVGPNTSCAFAEAVRSEWYSAGGGTTTVYAYSTVTGQSYSMYCAGGAPTVCRGGNNAVVYIR